MYVYRDRNCVGVNLEVFPHDCSELEGKKKGRGLTFSKALISKAAALPL
jgi:hypothetical protein